MLFCKITEDNDSQYIASCQYARLLLKGHTCPANQNINLKCYNFCIRSYVYMSDQPGFNYTSCSRMLCGFLLSELGSCMIHTRSSCPRSDLEQGLSTPPAGDGKH